MCADEVEADRDGCPSPHPKGPCGHFLRKVIPGPEKERGTYCCDTCNRHYQEHEISMQVEQASVPTFSI